MIAFVQPFGLSDGSGGGRILRSLLKDAPTPFVSVCTSPRPPAPPPFGFQEHVPKRPYFGRIEHTRFAPLVRWINRPVRQMHARRFRQRLTGLFERLGVTSVHAIPHGLEFWHAFEVARRLGLRYVLNVHDDMRYNLAGHPQLEEAMKRLGQVWNRADDRIVISQAMGEAYNERYGHQSYHVITDGLTQLPDRPQQRPTERIKVYFMGALHLTYHSNFETLTRSLEKLLDDHDVAASLTLRGSPMPSHIAYSFAVEERPYAPEGEIWKDLQEIDVLYLPLPFGEEYDPFTRYSMSTKLVTYLGSGLPIVYHGPAYAAAAQLLARHEAAIIVDSQHPQDLVEGFMHAAEHRERIVNHAIELAQERFWMPDQLRRFWSVVGVDREMNAQ